MTFDDFDIDPRCLRALHEAQITEPTPIQAALIPTALAGRDAIALAQTGTGKTLAFGLPSLTRLAAGPKRRNMMLVLTPTRELAVQVHGVLEEFGKPLHIHAACLYGGVGIEPQSRKLRKGCEVIVATPGRLLDHMSRGNVRFNDLVVLVLDEADRMLDMGFLPDIQRILRRLPEDRQTILSSATFPDEIVRFANSIQRDPERISVGSVSKPVDAVRQLLYPVAQSGKFGLLLKVLREEEIPSALIFLRTKSRTERLSKALRKAGFKAEAIHGDRSQAQRQQALRGFKEGRFPLLIATDVAARGLDIDAISHVVNYDIPENPEDYVHRIGRTARASAEGDAITFVSPDEAVALDAIEEALGHNLPRADWEGVVPVLSLYHPPEKHPKKRTASRSRRPRGLLRRR